MTATHRQVEQAIGTDARFKDASEERRKLEYELWGGVVDCDGNKLEVGDLVCCIGEPGKDHSGKLQDQGVYMQFLKVTGVRMGNPDDYMERR